MPQVSSTKSWRLLHNPAIFIQFERHVLHDVRTERCIED